MKSKENNALQYALAVDDDPGIRILVSSVLIALGFHVTTAENIKEAFAVLEAEGSIFNLVVTDFEMPGGTGADLLRKVVAEISPPPRMILFTGHELSLPAIEQLRSDLEGKYPIFFLSKNLPLKTMAEHFKAAMQTAQ